jgi:hypothetical protein
MAAQNRNKLLNVWRETIMASTHQEKCIELLNENGIEFDEKYLW